jgi:dihydrofolate synthase/folylpolyglutamate synthase
LVADREFGHSQTDRDRIDGTWTFSGWRGERRVRIEGLAMPAVALRNAAAALQAVLLLPDVRGEPQAWARAAAESRLPGRFERTRFRGRECVLDVAHNPHGAAFLARQIESLRSPSERTIAVFGCLKDKDAGGIVAALDEVVDEWVFVDSGTSRGQIAAATLDKVGTRIRAHLASDVASGLEVAAASAAAKDRILVLGSFDVVRQARRCVGAAT